MAVSFAGIVERLAPPALRLSLVGPAAVADRLMFGSDDRAVARRIALTAFLIRIVSAVIAYASQVLLARWMGDFEYGVYVLVWVGAVIVGADFHFGHNRRGNVDLLTEMGAELGFEVMGLELVGTDGEPVQGRRPVSSTAIREALRAGDLSAANDMLGRDHEVRGVVGHGDGRARDLGFPTANVGVADGMCLPSDGIYAGWYLTPDGTRHSAAISLGRRPTFYEDADVSVLEAHVLDFSDDLYGQAARVQFAFRLRDELKFDSVDALVAQMGRDCERARDLLAEETVNHGG